MSIKDLFEKIKPFYTLLLVLVVAALFFALGRLSALEERRTPIKVQYMNRGEAVSQSAAAISTLSVTETSSGAGSIAAGVSSTGTAASSQDTSGQVIGSKSGKKYYFPWCGTLQRVKPENRVPFASIAEARAAGYTPAGNCKGLK